jgi:hypothetical protein
MRFQVQGILIGVVAAFVIIVTIIGPECAVILPRCHVLMDSISQEARVSLRKAQSGV